MQEVLGGKLENLIAEYLIICTKIANEKPEIFIAKIAEIKNRIHEDIKDGKKSYWLERRYYEEFRENWDIIGKG